MDNCCLGIFTRGIGWVGISSSTGAGAGVDAGTAVRPGSSAGAGDAAEAAASRNERDCTRWTTANVAVTVDDRAGTPWLRTGGIEVPAFRLRGKLPAPDRLPLGQARRQGRVTPPKPLPLRNERDCARWTAADVAVTVDDRAGTPWLRTGGMRSLSFGPGEISGPRPTAVRPGLVGRGG